MKSMDEIYQELNEMISRKAWEQIEPFLTRCLDEAKEASSYGIYIAAGNELLGFYRETQQYTKAFLLSEDILLLMEEFHLEDTEHFALILMNTAAAYADAGRPAQAKNDLAKAIKILEDLTSRQADPSLEAMLARALTEKALLLLQEEGTAEGEALLLRALDLYESMEGRVTQEQQTIYHITVLSGLGESAYHRQDLPQALDYYEKAAAKSMDRYGAAQSTRVLWENCASLAKAVNDGEKQQYYRSLIEKG